MTVSDPDLASTYRQYLCAAGILCSRSRGTYRHRRQSANTYHRHRQILLCSTTSDSERSALSSTTRPANTNRCFGCQQGQLLLLRTGRCLRLSTRQAAFHPQRCRPTRVLSQALRTHQPVTPFLRDLHWLRVPERIQHNIVSAFWHSDVSMDQRRHISLRAFVGQPMWKVVATSAHLPP